MGVQGSKLLMGLYYTLGARAEEGGFLEKEDRQWGMTFDCQACDETFYVQLDQRGESTNGHNVECGEAEKVRWAEIWNSCIITEGVCIESWRQKGAFEGVSTEYSKAGPSWRTYSGDSTVSCLLMLISLFCGDWALISEARSSHACPGKGSLIQPSLLADVVTQPSSSKWHANGSTTWSRLQREKSCFLFPFSISHLECERDGWSFRNLTGS